MKFLTSILLIGSLVGCGSETSVSSTGTETTTETYSTSSMTTNSMTVSTTTSSTDTTPTVTMVSPCMDMTKSFDLSGQYYGPIFPLPGRAPGAFAEFKWGPWDQDMILEEFSFGFGVDLTGKAKTFKAAVWTEPGDPTIDPATIVKDYTIKDIKNVYGTHLTTLLPNSQIVVPKGQYLYTGGYYYSSTSAYGTFYKPICFSDRDYYWRPISCLQNDGSMVGPNHALLSKPKCDEISAFNADWIFEIKVSPKM